QLLGPPRELLSFPTRRSSDLGIVGARYRKSARAARPSEGCQDRTLNQNFAFLTVTTNSNSFFPVAEPARYEGPQARSPFAFRYYDKNRRVLGKTMEEQLRFAVCYWHSLT